MTKKTEHVDFGEKNKRTDLRKVCKNLHHVQAKSVNRATFQTSAHAYPDKSTS